MTERRVERIEVEGYTSIRAASVPLGQLNVLVGAKGAGKSNFVHALELLGVHESSTTSSTCSSGSTVARRPC